MSACIYYHPEAYTTSGPKLMGRHAAGESFLRGFLAYGKASEFWAQVERPEHAEEFAKVVKAAGRSEPIKIVSKSSLPALSQPGLVFFPGPGIGEHAWHRAAFGHGDWSLCGITHTICSATAMEGLQDLLSAPVQPWDAVICTSNAGKAVVTRLLQAKADYLVERLGAQRIVLPQLPVIPLGVNTADFVFSAPQRAAARAAIGADETTHVVLFVGRLSFHAKAHPLAMYQALHRAAAELPAGQKVLLVEFGLHPNAHIAAAYRAAAQLACPDVRVLTLDGSAPRNRDTAWAGADVFCSLSDNIQETFGIVPIEAMAAGLPVVVSDWDGYKDTVRDGVDGFRIPTLMPAGGLGADLAQRHAMNTDTFDMYIGQASSLVAVDVAAAAHAFGRLFASPALRAAMGAAGRERARSVFDWQVVIGCYEALWAQLADLRGARPHDQKTLAHPWPARMDPFHTFTSYPTQTLGAQTRLALADPSADLGAGRVAAYRELAMVNYAKLVLPTEAEVHQVLAGLSDGPAPAGELVRGFEAARQAFVFRSLTWLVKLGVLRLDP